MAETDPASFWDGKYRPKEPLYGTRPNRFLVDQAYRLVPGMRVLAVGDGEGRNGVWLAEQGMKVVSLDVSPRGLQKASLLALQRGVSLNIVCADVRDWSWPAAAYDAVVAIFLHLRPADRAAAHRRMLEALRPGGLLILEAFHADQVGYGSGGPPDPDMLYTAEALRGDLGAATFLELEETVETLDEGPGHRGPAALVRLVARR